MSKERLLIIEDDESIRDLLEILLQSRGFQVVLSASGEAGLEYAKQRSFDLILLDLTLPGIDGLEVCRRLRDVPLAARTPVIMLTARGEESDIVVGLEMGAVDYIVKPFNNQTLVARIRAQMRRTKDLTESTDSTESQQPEILQRDGIEINLTDRAVRLGTKPVELTFTEFELLLFLIRQPGRAWSRSEIAIALRGDEYAAFDRAIDIQVANLRKKLGDEGQKIETVRGIGYRWRR